MNPLRWKREHRFALFVGCIVGAIVGFALGVHQIPPIELAALGGPSGALKDTLLSAHLPGVMKWTAGGAILVGLSIYVRQLLHSEQSAS